MGHFMLEHLWKDRERSAHWAQRKYEGKMTWVENTPSWVLHVFSPGVVDEGTGGKAAENLRLDRGKGLPFQQTCCSPQVLLKNPPPRSCFHWSESVCPSVPNVHLILTNPLSKSRPFSGACVYQAFSMCKSLSGTGSEGSFPALSKQCSHFGPHPKVESLCNSFSTTTEQLTSCSCVWERCGGLVGTVFLQLSDIT